ncbi:MSMEG_0565 family glycosyltransferase [Terrabacter sp. MAHUQ-38]|uniref:MSMEG_0565 family glycosyltransferase n=1 Tax=unclassified Terrabacter TaxID=2630222 RepID=UPI00165E3F56|nr:MSMEG_0565 family glycosyltransferase [Terrabacter sp. MAHUQ-38]MBC9822897.1 MSMEG_0565 family glycosyltransferase [Terrabacter sp. MAHUQ-38]
MSTAEIGLVTYSTKPRGGVVHTLYLAEALMDAGVPVHIVTLGEPGSGFFRPTRVPYTVVPAPAHADTLEQRVFDSVDALERGLRSLGQRFALMHTQDCISARAAARIRDSGFGPRVVRTVHHIDDFTTPALIDCQRQAVLEPDAVLVVSSVWREQLWREFGVDAQVVHNGVDVGRFAPIAPDCRAELRSRVNAAGRFLFLAVGGVEPRKGSTYLFEALARLRTRMQPTPVLAVIGGQSFQDYERYRADALGQLAHLGLALGSDVVLLGTVPESEMAAWYRAADALAFPSVKEGFGLAVLEAMSADLPVVTSDLPVFREYLHAGRDALMAPVGDVSALCDALHTVATNAQLRRALVRAGRPIAARFSWQASAHEHRALYSRLLSTTQQA